MHAVAFTGSLFLFAGFAAYARAVARDWHSPFARNHRMPLIAGVAMSVVIAVVALTTGFAFGRW